MPDLRRIETCDLGGGYVEGFFQAKDLSAYLAVQTGIPYETMRARVIEAHGYCRRPPRSGEKVMMVALFDRIDEQAVGAMRRVIDEFLTASELEAIKRSYLASEWGDAWWIAYDLQMHPYLVIAALRHLHARGELPEPSA